MSELGTHAEPRPARARFSRAGACLAVVFLAWAALSILGHQSEKWAIDWTRALFGPVVLASCLAIVGAFVLGSRQPKKVVFSWVMASIVVIVTVGALESAAAFKLVHWRLLFERLAGDGSNFMWSFQLDPDLSYRRRPYDHWSGRPPSDIERGALMPPTLSEPISFTYDRWGYRNPSALEQADVVLIGDSYVEGGYVSDHQTTARRLQHHIGRPVANLGVAGYGTLQELIVLRRDAGNYDPKVVVWFFFEGNDLYDDEGFEHMLTGDPPDPAGTGAHAPGLTSAHSWSERSFALNLLERLRRWVHPLVPNWPPFVGYLTAPGHERQEVYFADYAGIPWSEWIAGRWKKARFTLETAAQVAREQRRQILFVFVPIKYRVYQRFVEFGAESSAQAWETWQIDREFEDFCRAADVPCIDLTPHFQKALSQQGVLTYSTVDTHWSQEGHELVARILQAELNRQAWLE